MKFFLEQYAACLKCFWKIPWSYLLLALVIMNAGNSLTKILIRVLSLWLIFSGLGAILIWLRERFGLDLNRKRRQDS